MNFGREERETWELLFNFFHKRGQKSGGGTARERRSASLSILDASDPEKKETDVAYLVNPKGRKRVKRGAGLGTKKKEG